MKILISKLLLLLCISFALVFLVDLTYRKINNISLHSLGPLWIEPAIEEKYQIVKVGNSHAVDAILFKGYNLRSLDLSASAQRFAYDLIMLKQYQNQIDTGAVIIINASPISFSHKIVGKDDSIQNNYYGKVSPFLIPDLNLSLYLQLQVVPFVKSGYSWRKDYNDAILERIAEENRLPEKQEEDEIILATGSAAALPTPPIPVAALSELSVMGIQATLASQSAATDKYVDNMNFIFNKWYHTDEFDTKYFNENRQDLEELIEFSLAQGWRPVVITIPVSETLEDGLLDDYKQIYLYDNINKTDLQGVEYIDFSQQKEIRTNEALFGNADHLNTSGGIVFSYVLLQELIARNYLTPDVDLYDYTELE